MKKNYPLLILFLSTFISAQNINLDAANFNTNGLGFMNVFDNPQNGTLGAFQFNGTWGIGDLVATADTGAETITLQPNRVNDAATPYWQTGTPGDLEGNKIMDASYYIQDNSLLGSTFTFNANVVTNTLDFTGFDFQPQVTAFIKVFDASFAVVAETSQDLTSTSGDFTITMDTNVAGAANVQYGFQFIAPNTNIDSSYDAAYLGLGSIVVGQNSVVLSTEDFTQTKFSVYPNPANSSWNITSNNVIDTVEVYNVIGKLVLSKKSDLSQVNIINTNLSSGIYIAKVTSGSSTQTLKLVKE